MLSYLTFLHDSEHMNKVTVNLYLSKILYMLPAITKFPVVKNDCEVKDAQFLSGPIYFVYWAGPRSQLAGCMYVWMDGCPCQV